MIYGAAYACVLRSVDRAELKRYRSSENVLSALKSHKSRHEIVVTTGGACCEDRIFLFFFTFYENRKGSSHSIDDQHLFNI